MVSKIFFLVAAFWAATIFFSCKKGKENIIPATKQNIQGSWKHDYPYSLIELYYNPPGEYELIKFSNDSFYMIGRTRTELLLEENCYQSTWLSYIKGVYSLKDSKLYFKGVYTTPEFEEKTSGCFGVGNYSDSFRISLNGKNLELYVLFSGKIPEDFRNIKMYKISNP